MAQSTLSHLQKLAIAPIQRTGDRVDLTTEQQHYLRRVLRLEAGDRFIVMDGQSGWWLAELGTEPDQATCLEAIAIQNELPVSVTLLMAMPKSGMDDVVRQVTELGVAAIVPVQSDRTLLNPSPQKLDRWRRIAQEAAEQSERQIIPTIHEPQSWTGAIAQAESLATLRLIALERSDSPSLLQALSPLENRPEAAIAIAIGPEGGWTTAEAKRAIAAGFQPVTLGARILRSVTAPVAALAVIAAVFEDPVRPRPEALS